MFTVLFIFDSVTECIGIFCSAQGIDVLLFPCNYM